MSLIESALDKLRRAESNAESARAPAPRISGAAAPVSSLAPLLPPADEDRKLAKVPAEVLRKMGYLPEQGLERRFADHYRRVKRPLIERALAGPPEMRLILISSALPGDGKTFTSINLALSMARERDVSVLLVDADGPRARVSDVLGIRNDPGLLDALVDETVDVERLVQRTDIRGLEVLPAGRFTESATELIASGRMSQVAIRLAALNTRRLVVFDSAPLLVSSEARALTRVPGQVVLVVRAGVTPKRAVQDAIAQVDRSKLQGVVVNQARGVLGEDYYEYSGYGSTSGADGSAP